VSTRRTWVSRRSRIGAAVLVAAVLPGVLAVAADDVSPDRASALTHLVRQDCGSCHGMTLKGGLGPALTPVALTGRSPADLAWVISRGRGARAMPGWAPLLSAHDIDWIARGLLDGRFLPDHTRVAGEIR
jgi:cytochrome c55X